MGEPEGRIRVREHQRDREDGEPEERGPVREPEAEEGHARGEGGAPDRAGRGAPFDDDARAPRDERARGGVGLAIGVVVGEDDEEVIEDPEEVDHDEGAPRERAFEAVGERLSEEEPRRDVRVRERPRGGEGSADDLARA